MLSIAVGLIAGLLIGSFLNVVIYRLPVMMERDWAQQFRDMQAEKSGTAPEPDAEDEPAFNLLTPPSTCPQCNTRIAPWHNVPVVSWLLLRGRCAACAVSIPVRYPAVELLTGVLTAGVLWHFGLTPAGLAAVFFLWTLIALSFIDFDHQLLPDSITLLLLWVGLAIAALQPSAIPAADLNASVLGAIFGYLSLWSVYWLFKLATGKEGMGYGDFKLLAAMGAWLGLQQLPIVIMMSAVTGAVIGIAMILALGRDRQLPMPFGPYLACAGLISYLWGEQLLQRWLAYIGI